MAKWDEIPKTLDQGSMKQLLERNGWIETRGGKHVVKMEKDGERPITLPRCKGQVYGRGLRSRILREAGLQGPEGPTNQAPQGSGETT